jgi:hypothetical protein
VLRESTRVAVISFLFVVGLWLTREAYDPGRQYRFPWITATTIAVTAGIARGFWYHRHPPPRRRRRSGDPGE